MARQVFVYVVFLLAATHVLSVASCFFVGGAQHSAPAGIRTILFVSKRAWFCVSIVCTRIFLRCRIFSLAGAQCLCVASFVRGRRATFGIGGSSNAIFVGTRILFCVHTTRGRILFVASAQHSPSAGIGDARVHICFRFRSNILVCLARKVFVYVRFVSAGAPFLSVASYLFVGGAQHSASAGLRAIHFPLANVHSSACRMCVHE